MIVVPLVTRVETLWADYVEAKRRSDVSMSIADGMVAARAWHAWLKEFESVTKEKDVSNG